MVELLKMDFLDEIVKGMGYYSHSYLNIINMNNSNNSSYHKTNLNTTSTKL